MAGMDRLSIQSLWSLMGLVIRNAERLGIHRDGTLLGLSPFEVEERRRVWWQLQHVDLALAIKGGLTPLTLMADWDAKLPLNIEDDDMKMTATEMPKERKGLTSLSYCLYTYWVLNEQRRFFRDRQLRFRLSWQASTSLKQTDKDSLLDELETGIGQNFLQYCDPLRPIDVLIQFSAKALILVMRIRALHPLVYGDNSTQATQESRDELLELCVRCLEYSIATRLQSLLQNFQWWVKGIFSWLALMCVIVEVLQQQDEARTERLWSLLADLYSANTTLSDLTRDRRKHHMAKLIVSAWKARQDRSSSGTSSATPTFITDLESRLSAFRAGNGQNHTDTTMQQQNTVQPFDPTLSDSYLASLDTDTFDFDLQDIDWSYWSSIS
ncbi:hypothetical protein LTR05_008369 [Lithohypha guttulata]|uniref:Xylanolytic transcriptional activator regulatory domain-containing protein n=1 Tax=Lithohypha guttulata TaxID=1690604 RepID=A0AAN7PQA7_9EURO|nr:hypothetical protein LTR05_008369 [Lithohypha guttulata]